MSDPEFAADEPLSESAAQAYLARTCFTTGPTERLGVEIEHVVHDSSDWSRPVSAERLDQLIDSLDLAAGGAVTREPGGQLELSTLPHDGATAAVAAADRDLTTLYRAAERDGLTLLGEGTDPLRPPQRTLQHPRYDAMEAYLDSWLPAGRQMMCSTAAVQITVEGGQRVDDIAPTWELLHAMGPTLVAMFANSPFLEGRATGWKCTRQDIWWSLDPARTRPVHTSSSAASPVDEYVAFALDAPVMMIRTDSGAWQRPPGLTFRQWLQSNSSTAELPAPTQDDLAYHLTTLFPPVRARGPLELRYLDAQPGRGWLLPIAVVCGLIADERTRDATRAAVEPVADRWVDAARHGLDDAALARAASTLVWLARTSLSREHRNHELVGLLDTFTEQFVDRGRCPADDRLDEGPDAARIISLPRDDSQVSSRALR